MIHVKRDRCAGAHCQAIRAIAACLHDGEGPRGAAGARDCPI